MAPALTGSEATKNKLAAAKLQEILDSAKWVNLHSILDAGRGSLSSTTSVCVLEVRVASGHGARWSWKDAGRWTHRHMQHLLLQYQGMCNDSSGGGVLRGDIGDIISFRGFVEPMEVGGHEKKWRH